jgi:hypothetical protein
LQWKYILARIKTDLASIPEHRQISISYESLVASPRPSLARLLSLCHLSLDKNVLDLADTIRDMNVKWQHELGPEKTGALEHLIGDALLEWGYRLSYNPE